MNNSGSMKIMYNLFKNENVTVVKGAFKKENAILASKLISSMVGEIKDILVVDEELTMFQNVLHALTENPELNEKGIGEIGTILDFNNTKEYLKEKVDSAEVIYVNDDFLHKNRGLVKELGFIEILQESNKKLIVTSSLTRSKWFVKGNVLDIQMYRIHEPKENLELETRIGLWEEDTKGNGSYAYELLYIIQSREPLYDVTREEDVYYKHDPLFN